ncbi:unnamed protein product [Scytosiphon promiscuus]
MMLVGVLVLIPAMGVLGMKHDLAVKAAFPAGQQRSWVTIPSKSDAGSHGGKKQWGEASERIRILSYNVLGARQGLSNKHGHVGVDVRNWTTRRDRLREEIWSYDKSAPGGVHVICLQEVTFRTLGDTWIPFMARLGLDRHVYQPKSDRPQKRHKSRCLGVAIFYSSKRFDKTAELRVVFSEEARGLRGDSDRKRRKQRDGGCMSEPLEASGTEKRSRSSMSAAASSASSSDQFLRRVYGGDTGTGGPDGREDPATASRLEQDLEEKHDAAALVRLKLKEDGDLGERGDPAAGQGERSITVGCAHLFYDPRRPDLKTAQCQMLFQAIERFHKQCGVAGAPTGRESPSHSPANLILCADFNSKPVVDPRFLPGPLKAAAEARLPTAAPVHRPQGPSAPHTSRQDPKNFAASTYPGSQATASGVYSLLSYGSVPSTHPEHPDSFIPHFSEWEKVEAQRREQSNIDVKKRAHQRPRRAKDAPIARATHSRSGEWTSGFGATLEDAYRDRGAVSPSFTTKTSTFSGIIDHVFVSTGEEGSDLAISGVLAFPPGANLSGNSKTATPRIVAEERDTSSRGRAVIPEDEVDGQVGTADGGSGQAVGSEEDGFPPIPNERWGSDHLALGVEVAFL